MYTLDASALISSTTTYNQVNPVPASKVVVSGIRVFALVQDTGSSFTRIQKLDHSGTLFTEVNLPITYKKMALSNNNLKILVWDSVTSIKIISMAGFSV